MGFLKQESTMWKTKISATVFYASACVATANWLDYGLAEGYGGKALMYLAAVGSAALLVAAITALFTPRYGIVAGSAALCLLWPYFALLMFFIPWGRLLWLGKVQYHGMDQILALFFLLIATAYSLTQRRYWRVKQA